MSSLRTFTDRLIAGIREKQSVLCVGLDPQLRHMPPHLMKWAMAERGRTNEAVGLMFWRFNREIINAVAPFAPVVKPQAAFYEAYGHEGIRALEETIAYARSQGLLVITDAKRGDGGDTAEAYAQAHLGQVPFWPEKGSTELSLVESPLRTDALTIHGWIGEACVGPFVAQMLLHGTGAFVVCKTSFKPNSALELLPVRDRGPVWQELAHLVSHWGEGTEGAEGYRNLGVVLGATYPEDAPAMRQILPKSWFLIPGYGAQGGGADGAVAGINLDGFGGIVNSSRAITFAWGDPKSPFKCAPEDFANAAAQAAKAARDDLNAALVRAEKAAWLKGA